eukprot:scaffold13012_cov109-Isochrysis_galbana.AAC.2
MCEEGGGVKRAGCCSEGARNKSQMVFASCLHPGIGMSSSMQATAVRDAPTRTTHADASPAPTHAREIEQLGAVAAGETVGQREHGARVGHRRGCQAQPAHPAPSRQRRAPDGRQTGLEDCRRRPTAQGSTAERVEENPRGRVGVCRRLGRRTHQRPGARIHVPNPGRRARRRIPKPASARIELGGEIRPLGGCGGCGGGRALGNEWDFGSRRVTEENHAYAQRARDGAHGLVQSLEICNGADHARGGRRWGAARPAPRDAVWKHQRRLPVRQTDAQKRGAWVNHDDGLVCRWVVVHGRLFLLIGERSRRPEAIVVVSDITTRRASLGLLFAACRRRAGALRPRLLGGLLRLRGLRPHCAPGVAIWGRGVRPPCRGVSASCGSIGVPSWGAVDPT